MMFPVSSLAASSGTPAPAGGDWFAQQGAPTGSAYPNYIAPGGGPAGSWVPGQAGVPAQQGAPGGVGFTQSASNIPGAGQEVKPDGSLWTWGDFSPARQVSPPGTYDPKTGQPVNPSGAPDAGTLTTGQDGLPRMIAPDPTTGAPVAPAPAVPTSIDPSGDLTSQISAYFKARGVSDQETPYWVSKWPELVARGQELGDPQYAMKRLAAADVFGGGGAAGGAAGTIGAGLEQTPGFQFRLDEGLKALQRSAAAKGTLLTGGTLKGLERYAQDYASGEYGQRVNQLASLAQLGYGAAGQQAGIGQTYANTAGNLLGGQAQNTGNLLTGIGNAQAAGTVGSANAWAQGLSNATNAAQQYYLLSLLGGGGGGLGGGGTGAGGTVKDWTTGLYT